ncbi:RsmB/NOP family class I SAM-dependent RNA methyltransferase [Sulfuracidifex tepidarius]|uniref:RsmB/NOP family class I SAM-dependent RNA methyltransferase n=1 Tax=Sulfuracidifex tepidarius TaxID=1294262 RepID=UPI0006D27C11|nr:RsmB/NOP family class I SAM-dependent RNA methyltransferase [Sulfuracidifex tepidarius]
MESKVHVSSLDLVKDFRVIIQDKASVAVVNELEAEAGDELVDLSSAPGNKLSLFAMLTENKFKAIALDLDQKRLEKERLFLKKAGVDLDRVSFVLHDSTTLAMRSLVAQKVLLDAPCSSSGMIYNDPSILLSLKDKTKVDFFSRIQKEILRSAVQRLSPYLMVYSVCSIFPEEGEEITDLFSDFLVPLRKKYSHPYRGFKSVQSTRLFPFSEQTEGFYIAKFKIQ